MKQLTLSLAALICLGAHHAAAAAVESSEAQPPNVVFIFIDDMGYGDIGPFGSTTNETPNLDRMAAEGLKMTDFYVSSTACSPSRAALLTGCYADRVSMDGRVCFPGQAKGLNPDEITCAEMLKAKGYATGCFGKWHLGDAPQFLPLNQGFDVYEGIPYSNDMWPLLKAKRFPPLPYIKQNQGRGSCSRCGKPSVALRCLHRCRDQIHTATSRWTFLCLPAALGGTLAAFGHERARRSS